MVANRLIFFVPPFDTGPVEMLCGSDREGDLFTTIVGKLQMQVILKMRC